MNTDKSKMKIYKDVFICFKICNYLRSSAVNFDLNLL